MSELKWNTILFDLDGTLTDPKQGITRCVQYALAKMGIDEPDLDKLVPFIGPPLAESFQVFYGMSAAQAAAAVQYYRERFASVGLYENRVYPGITDLLTDLAVRQRTLVVATSKPTVFSVTILEHFGLAEYFRSVIGSNLDGTRVDKAEVIAAVLGELADNDPGRTVMVGDRRHDIAGAHKNGLVAAGVAYGYGGRDELEQAGADYVVDSVADLRELLLRPLSGR